MRNVIPMFAGTSLVPDEAIEFMRKAEFLSNSLLGEVAAIETVVSRCCNVASSWYHPQKVLNPEITTSCSTFVKAFSKKFILDSSEGANALLFLDVVQGKQNIPEYSAAFQRFSISTWYSKCTSSSTIRKGTVIRNFWKNAKCN